MIYKVTFGINGKSQGWQEGFAMLNASINPIDLYPTVLDIANKRAQMLGREFTIVAIRIARYSTEGGVRQRGAYFKRVNITNSVTTQTAAAEPANVALIVRGSAQLSQVPSEFDSNQNNLYLGAPLDVSVDNAGEVFEGKGGLGAAFTFWRSVILGASAGWLANKVLTDAEIKTITQNVNGTVTIETAAPMPGTVVPGQKYKCRCRQVNEGNSPLNRELIWRATDATHLVSVRVVGIPSLQKNGNIKIYQQVQPFIDFGDLVLQAQVGKHKRGRPYGSSPGRRKKQVLG